MNKSVPIRESAPILRFISSITEDIAAELVSAEDGDRMRLGLAEERRDGLGPTLRTGDANVLLNAKADKASG